MKNRTIQQSLVAFMTFGPGKIIPDQGTGNFSEAGLKPVVGDQVSLRRKTNGGLPLKILPRKNQLVRPIVQRRPSVVVTAVKNPTCQRTY